MQIKKIMACPPPSDRVKRRKRQKFNSFNIFKKHIFKNVVPFFMSNCCCVFKNKPRAVSCWTDTNSMICSLTIYNYITMYKLVALVNFISTAIKCEAGNYYTITKNIRALWLPATFSDLYVFFFIKYLYCVYNLKNIQDNHRFWTLWQRGTEYFKKSYQALQVNDWITFENKME